METPQPSRTGSSVTPEVLVFRELPADQLTRIRNRYTVTVANPRKDSERAAFAAALPSVRGLIGSSYVLTPEVLDRAPRLRVISSISAGIDNYPLGYLRSRGIVLCHTPGVLTETTADAIFGLLLAVSRRIVDLTLYVRSGHWVSNIGPEMFGHDVHGKTIGILGMGRIGQAVARRAALGFGMRVLYHNRHVVPADTLGALAPLAHYAEREALLNDSDFVVCTLPLTEATRNLMDASAFSAMREHAIFINGSRGGLVDESALLAALDSGRLRGAGLDVFQQEPLPMDARLRTHPKVVQLPHAGSATEETRHAMATLATDNLLAVLEHRLPRDCTVA